MVDTKQLFVDSWQALVVVVVVKDLYCKEEDLYCKEEEDYYLYCKKMD